MSAVMAPWPDSEHHVDEHNIGIPDAVFVKLMIAMFTSTFIFVFLGGFLNHWRNYRSFSSGLNASILNSLPVFVYSKSKSKINANNVVEDCCVCLSEFEERDQCLVLPNCKHCFHSGCIHIWFSNHSTCPLCRSPVVIVDQVTTPHPTTASSIQTTTSSSEPAVVDVRIDIVPVVNETEPESQITSQVEEEEEEEEEISINISQSLV
ncbi:putative transcription factor C2H2 family [Helianthus annuus]|nr:putative transcription factor C2H2 family [Helianthus annuus]KAJ0647185.1 putative transcription factor C2H2 family [Helianthus annuus]KAJ0842937.1 putative transcription factor C2H2 family [Helianthus annuus]